MAATTEVEVEVLFKYRVPNGFVVQEHETAKPVRLDHRTSKILSLKAGIATIKMSERIAINAGLV